MFIRAVSSRCTHNALLILILKYPGMHSLLQETHLKWWICKCPPSTFSCYHLLHLNARIVPPRIRINAPSHIASGHTQYSHFDFFHVSCVFFPHFTPTKTGSEPAVFKSYPELNVFRAHQALMCSYKAHQSELHLSPATSHFLIGNKNTHC